MFDFSIHHHILYRQWHSIRYLKPGCMVRWTLSLQKKNLAYATTKDGLALYHDVQKNLQKCVICPAIIHYYAKSCPKAILFVCRQNVTYDLDVPVLFCDEPISYEDTISDEDTMNSIPHCMSWRDISKTYDVVCYNIVYTTMVVYVWCCMWTSSKIPTHWMKTIYSYIRWYSKIKNSVKKKNSENSSYVLLYAYMLSIYGYILSMCKTKET